MIAMLVGVPLLTGHLYASDFKAAAACPKTEDVKTFLSQPEFDPKILNEDRDNILDTIPEIKRALITNEDNLSVHWTLTSFKLQKFHRAQLPVESVHFIDNRSTYTPQSQVCIYDAVYTVESHETMPILRLTFTRLKEGAQPQS